MKFRFESPYSVREDLYRDDSQTHQDAHSPNDASLEERILSKKRVDKIAQDPASGRSLAPDEIPLSAILSRIGNDVDTEGFMFKPTDETLLAHMTAFQDALLDVIQKHGFESDHYLLQKPEALHFSFGGVTAPQIREVFGLQRIRELTKRPQHWRQLIQHFQRFLDEVQPRLKFKEIKLNDDGHVVLRMTIVQDKAYLEFRNLWQQHLDDNYVRYDEPEKITTLACVIGVVNKFNLAWMMFISDMNALLTKTTAKMWGTSYSFDSIQLAESSNRMHQKQDKYGELTLRRGYVRLYEPKIGDPSPVAPEFRFYRLYQQYVHINKGLLFPAKPGLTVCESQVESDSVPSVSVN